MFDPETIPVCAILEQQPIPDVDSLVAPTLDHSVINVKLSRLEQKIRTGTR